MGKRSGHAQGKRPPRRRARERWDAPVSDGNIQGADDAYRAALEAAGVLDAPPIIQRVTRPRTKLDPAEPWYAQAAHPADVYGET